MNKTELLYRLNNIRANEYEGEYSYQIIRLLLEYIDDSDVSIEVGMYKL